MQVIEAERPGEVLAAKDRGAWRSTGVGEGRVAVEVRVRAIRRRREIEFVRMIRRRNRGN